MRPQLVDSSDGKRKYRVRLENHPEHGYLVLKCDCEGWRHRERCKHQRHVALTHLMKEPCPACGGHLEVVGQSMAGNDIIACNRCEFSVDFAPEKK